MTHVTTQTSPHAGYEAQSSAPSPAFLDQDPLIHSADFPKQVKDQQIQRTIHDSLNRGA